MTKEDRTEKNYIDELNEWQNHQYDPGHFLGGKIPIWIREPGRPKLLGASFLITGVIAIVAIGYSFISKQLGNITEITGSIVYLLFSVLCVLFGIKLLRKKQGS